MFSLVAPTKGGTLVGEKRQKKGATGPRFSSLGVDFHLFGTFSHFLGILRVFKAKLAILTQRGQKAPILTLF